MKTANVIVSFFLKPLLDLDQGIISLSELERKSESIFVFDNTPNSSLLKFRHEVGGGGGGNSSQLVQIEIVDPEFRLERAFANTRFTGILPKNYRDSSLLDSSGVTTEDQEEYLGTLRDRFPAFNVAETDLDVERVGTTPSVWITYGVGEDYSNWCAPFKAIFYESTVSYSNGSRILTLSFAPGIYLLDLEKNDFYGPKFTTQPTEAVQTVEAKSHSFVVVPVEEKPTIDFVGSIRLGLKDYSGFSQNRIDDKIETFFIDYLSKVYDVERSEIIVLIPKISKLFEKELANLYKKYQYKVDNNQISYRVLANKDLAVKFHAEKELAQLLGFETELEFSTTEELLDLYNPVHANYSKSGLDNGILVDFHIKTNRNNQSLMDSYDNILANISNNQVYFINFATHFQSNSYLTTLFQDYDLSYGDRVLVFGDSRLIRRYLYGGVNFDITPEESKKHSDLLYSYHQVLLTKDYNRKAINERRDKEIVNSVPRTFFSQTDTIDADTVNRLRVPVFRYNTEDPNVLSLDLDQGKTNTVVLQSLPTKAAQWQNTLGTDGISETFSEAVGDVTQEQLEDICGKYLDIALEGRVLDSEIGDLGDKMVPTSPGKLAEFLVRANANLAVNYPKTKKVLRGLSGDNLFSHNLRAMSLLYAQAVQGTIQTLPHFWLSNHSIIGDACVLFSLEPRSFGVTSLAPTRAAYSGVYTIVGFVHTIEPKSVMSEFTVVKNAHLLSDSDLEKEIEENDSVENKKITLKDRLVTILESEFIDSDAIDTILEYAPLVTDDEELLDNLKKTKTAFDIIKNHPFINP